MNLNSLPADVRVTVEAVQNKKAEEVVVLDLSGLGAFTGCFVICTGLSGPQVQAISNEVEGQLARIGRVPKQREGYSSAEWVLLDFGDFIVHIFSHAARHYYDLERLWRPARRLEFPDAVSNAFPGSAVKGL